MFAPLIAKRQSKTASNARGEPGPRQPTSLGYRHGEGGLRLPRLLGPIQAKLAIGSVHDPLEDEADRVADQVMRAPDSGTALTAAPIKISRKCTECEEEAKLQKKRAEADETAVSEAPRIAYDVLRSPGQPLEESSRAYFEPRFGHDFSAVRVHVDAMAAESAVAVNALAYTVGKDVVFQSGHYAPETSKGRRLLAHELAHVVQQSKCPDLRWNPVKNASPAWEADADRAAAGVVSGQDARVELGGLPPIIQKAPPKSSTIPPTPSSPIKIINGTTPLSKRVQAYRIDNKTPARVNLVAVEYSTGTSGPQISIFESWPGVAHSEEMMDQFFRDEQQKGRGPITVNEVYSERQFCGPSEHDCQGLLYTRYPRAKKTFAYNYQETLSPGLETRAGRTRTSIEQHRERLVESKNLEWDFGKPRGEPPPHDERSDPGPLSKRPRRIYGGKRQVAPPTSLSSTSLSPGPTPTTVAPTSGTGSGQSAARGRLSADAARAITRLDAEASRAAQFTGRIRTYVAAWGALEQGLSLLDTIEAAEQIFSHGTVFPDEQKKANEIASQSAEALQSAEDSTAGNAYLGAISDIWDARERGDQQGLFELSGALGKLGMELSDSANKMTTISTELDLQAQAMLRASRNNKEAATHGMDDAAMAQAAALYISTEKLGNTLKGAAENFSKAAETLNSYYTLINSAAAAAEEAAWALGYARIIEIQHEIDRLEKAKPQPLTPAADTSFHGLTLPGSGPGGGLTEKDKAMLLEFMKEQ